MIARRNWRPSFAHNLFASIDWDYVFRIGIMNVRANGSR